MKRLVLTGAAAATALILACSAGEVASPSNDSPAAAAGIDEQGTTFHKDVEPILQRSCQKCHQEGGIAPFSLMTYADAKAVAGSMVTQTKARIMPPWGAHDTDECTPPHPWKDDQRLSHQDLMTIEQWHLEGDREGNPASAPPPVDLKPIGLVNPTILKPAAPFDLATAGKANGDTLKCFVLDPGLTQSRYVNGTFFVPKNKTIVHHALAFAAPKGAQTPPEKAGQPSDTPYDCFGGPQVDGVGLLAAWAPGAVPAEYPANVGTELAAGTRIIMQVHYHPHARATPEPDQTELHLRFMDTAPEWIALTQLLGNFRGPRQTALANVDLLVQPGEAKAEFVVPPNAVGHTETMTVKFNPILPELKVAGVAAHMHLAGRDQKITVKKADGSEMCLLQEPAWDFDWQRGYQYDVPIEQLPTVKGGDEIQIRCKYDNAISNPKLAIALKDEGKSVPEDIKLGESTLEEMCLSGFVFLRKAR